MPFKTIFYLRLQFTLIDIKNVYKAKYEATQGATVSYNYRSVSLFERKGEK